MLAEFLVDVSSSRTDTTPVQFPGYVCARCQAKLYRGSLTCMRNIVEAVSG